MPACGRTNTAQRCARNPRQLASCAYSTVPLRAPMLLGNDVHRPSRILPMPTEGWSISTAPIAASRHSAARTSNAQRTRNKRDMTPRGVQRGVLLCPPAKRHRLPRRESTPVVPLRHRDRMGNNHISLAGAERRVRSRATAPLDVDMVSHPVAHTPHQASKGPAKKGTVVE